MTGASGVLRRALRDHRGAVFAGTILLCLYQLAEMSVPVLLGVIVDRALTSESWWAPVLSVVALGVAITMVSVSWRTAYRFLQRANADHVRRLRALLARRVIADRDIDSEVPRDEYVTVIAEDTTLTSDIIEIVPVALAATIGVVAGAVLLTVIDPLLGGVVFAGTILLLTVLNLLSRIVTRKGEEQQQLIAAATARVADLLRGLRPLAGFAGRGAAYRHYRTLSGKARRQAEGLARISGVYEGISAGTATLLVGVVGVLAGARAFSGAISIGDLVAVVGLTQFVAEPLSQLSRIPRYTALARASARRIALIEGTEVPTGGSVLPAAGSAPDLVVGEGAQRPGAERIEVRAGELLAVDCDADRAAILADAIAAGPDVGADAPTVVVRGTDAARLDATSVRRAVLADARHPAIFRGTVGSVVDPPGSHFTGLDDPAGVLTDVGLDELDRPDTPLLDREVADRGANLSGGQRQRLALARALHADPDVLILVDPLSAVDAVTGSRVAEAVARRRRGKTTVILAASPAFRRIADNVVHLGDDEG
ncbi:ABC transporter ATP-binding protein [Gordonia sinesedis]